MGIVVCISFGMFTIQVQDSLSGALISYNILKDIWSWITN